MPRCKPFKYIYEKEIGLYAYFKQLVYFPTEYSPNALEDILEMLKDLKRLNPSAILEIIHSI
jgi:cytoplasmic tRNA 2-thiolation protein 1